MVVVSSCHSVVNDAERVPFSAADSAFGGEIVKALIQGCDRNASDLVHLIRVGQVSSYDDINRGLRQTGSCATICAGTL